MQRKIDPGIRILIIIVATAVVFVLSFFLTGEFLPNDPREALVFQNALLLVVLGSAFLERYFTKPADSVINSLMGLISLASVYNLAPRISWYLISGYCLIIFIISSVCVAVSTGSDVSGWREKIAKFTYRPSVVLGRSKTLFSIVLLSGLWFFYNLQHPITITVVLFWGIFLAIWPLQIPELITSWITGELPSSFESTGKIIRIDHPNIVRVQLFPNAIWEQEPKIYFSPSGNSFWVQPLFSEFHENQLLGTGLITNIEGPPDLARHKNCVIGPRITESIPSPSDINNALGGGENSTLLGFVIEKSGTKVVRFEVLNTELCFEGMLVWIPIKNEIVYFQVIDGETSEETFGANKHGFQFAFAQQLGTLRKEVGFEKSDWLPLMNSPVFTRPKNMQLEHSTLSENDFKLGHIPNSKIEIGGDFISKLNFHTAILGVTGSGKTELAFDIIRWTQNHDLKTICIDLTNQYKTHLGDLSPVDLSIEEETASELSRKLFDVETGSYGAGEEKKALEEFASELREQVNSSVSNFIESTGQLGLIRLEEISNTKATLWITELYMTCLLTYARDNIQHCPKILIVVEEAHTVMPESGTMGLGDFDSKGLVGKIAQIALQGRKYGVGLLVLAQRTATVSKSVLTQCNTIISFACYDDTSLGFLKNIFGEDFVRVIPSLKKLQAVAFGPWIKSEQPVIFEVPFDPGKDTG